MTLKAVKAKYGDAMIRKVLAIAVNKGEVVRDEKQHSYILAAP